MILIAKNGSMTIRIIGCLMKMRNLWKTISIHMNLAFLITVVSMLLIVVRWSIFNNYWHVWCYKKKCKLKDHKVLSLSSYTRKIKSMNISFAKLGHKECEVCIKYDEHSCLSNSIETKCAYCSSVNQQKKGKMNVYVAENTLKLRRKSALRGKKYWMQQNIRRSCLQML